MALNSAYAPCAPGRVGWQVEVVVSTLKGDECGGLQREMDEQHHPSTQDSPAARQVASIQLAPT